MKILATFDESAFSEASLPVLEKLAALPGVKIELCSAAEVTASFDEAAIDKHRQALEQYLLGIRTRLPDGPAYDICVEVAMYPMDAAAVLIEHAESARPDVILMATHGRSGVLSLLVGSVADKVVRAGVAPVLLVRPHPSD